MKDVSKSIDFFFLQTIGGRIASAVSLGLLTLAFLEWLVLDLLPVCHLWSKDFRKKKCLDLESQLFTLNGFLFFRIKMGCAHAAAY